MKKLLTRIMRKNKDKLSNTNLLEQQDLKTDKKYVKTVQTLFKIWWK